MVAMKYGGGSGAGQAIVRKLVTQHQLLRKEPVEVLRHRRGFEHLAESQRQHEPTQQRGDGVSHRIPQPGIMSGQFCTTSRRAVEK
jgi:hypothetical protein